jgi:hypothetical protein
MADVTFETQHLLVTYDVFEKCIVKGMEQKFLSLPSTGVFQLNKTVLRAPLAEYLQKQNDPEEK